MPQTKSNSSSKRQAGRRSDPKLFRCTGFGNCDMVFTRSEHLARHARKHTGEKPFRCVVPNCDRMFSRFDNMMQHTHTHNRSKKKDSSDSSDGRPSPMSVPEDNSMMLVPPMPNSPNSSYAEPQYHHKQEQSTHMYHPHMYYQQQQHLPPPSPTNEKEYLKYQHYYNNYPVQYMNQGQSRMCEGQPWPPVYYSPATPPQYHQQHYTATTVIPSPPQQTMADQEQHQSQPPHHPVTPADYNNNSRNSNSVRKNSIHSEKAYQHKRRMSYIELTTPIQELGSHYSSNHTTIATIVDSNSSSGSSSDDDDDDERQMSPISMSTDCTTTHNKSSRFKSDGSIDITADEYEALQGFGKFCTEPVIREPMLMTRITTSPTCSVSVPVNLPPLRNTHFSPTAVLSNNTTSQVHAFRQQIPTVQESFRRGGF